MFVFKEPGNAAGIVAFLLDYNIQIQGWLQDIFNPGQRLIEGMGYGVCAEPLPRQEANFKVRWFHQEVLACRQRTRQCFR